MGTGHRAPTIVCPSAGYKKLFALLFAILEMAIPICDISIMGISRNNKVSNGYNIWIIRDL